MYHGMTTWLLNLFRAVRYGPHTVWGVKNYIASSKKLHCYVKLVFWFNSVIYSPLFGVGSKVWGLVTVFNV